MERARTAPHWCYPRYEDAFAEAERITWHQDEPYGSTSIFAQWCVFREARRAGLKVMLDGQGADEQLAGYHGSFSYYFTSLIRQRRFAALLRAMGERKRWHGVSFADQARTFLLPLLPTGSTRWLRRERQTVGGTPGSMARRCARILGVARSTLRASGLVGLRSSASAIYAST